MANNSISQADKYSEANFVVYNPEELKSFLSKLFQHPRPDYATFSFPVDSIDPLAYLEMRWQSHSFQYYWEKPADEFAIAAGEELLNISASGPNRFNDINRKFQSVRDETTSYSAVSHPYSGMLFLGGFSFFDQIEDTDWDSFEPASFTVPKWMLVKDGKFNIVTINIELEAFDLPEKLFQHLQDEIDRIEQSISLNTQQNGSKTINKSAGHSISLNGSGRENWISSVDEAKKMISNQTFDKLVLARQASISLTADIVPTQILNKLRQEYTCCYNFLIHQPSNKTFLGSTPERLGAFRNQLLLTEALAGSIDRGKTATEDTILERNLSSSQKDQNEHHFVVQDIEERLASFVNSIERSREPEIKKLANVQHLYTPIRAQLKENTNLFEVIDQLHPTPAVGGYPWEDAEKFISKLEDFERGWYAGPVGWFNGSGDGEFAVAIRSGFFTPSKAYFFAGCGIVSNSNAEAEWQETNLKLKPMLSALQYD